MLKINIIRSYISKFQSHRNYELADKLINEREEFSNANRTSLLKYVADIRNGRYDTISKQSSPKSSQKKLPTQIVVGKTDWIRSESEMRKLKEKNVESDKRIKILCEELDIASKAVNTALSLDNRKKNEKEIKPEAGKTTSEATAFMVLSDIHLEERVDESTINGLNEFNLDIAKDSIYNFFRRGVRLTSIFGKDVKINNIVVPMLGDIISGYIHEELLEDNYLSPIQSIMLASDLLGNGINYLLKNTKCKLTFVCKVGNHGRISERKKISTEYKNSYEWLLYHQLKKEFKSDDRIDFIIDNGYLSYLNVYDRVIRFHHGHNIKYGGGVGGISIPAVKAIAQWDKQKSAYLDVFGHFHTLMLDTGTNGKFVSNGSIVGYNAYGMAIKATYDEPKQAFFLIDKQRGKTVAAPIFVR